MFKLTEARALSGFSVWLRYIDGTEGIVEAHGQNPWGSAPEIEGKCA